MSTKQMQLELPTIEHVRAPNYLAVYAKNAQVLTLASGNTPPDIFLKFSNDIIELTDESLITEDGIQRWRATQEQMRIRREVAVSVTMSITATQELKESLEKALASILPNPDEG